ncbi:MAG: hypothetical protein LIO68_05890 [Rikenellaceae bacterium]|nr:hypothetical protein [Rikenellaceae bacterium]
MESGLVIQLLIVAGIIAYGMRSAMRKGKQRGERSQHRMPAGENFPFPAPDYDRVPEREVVTITEQWDAGEVVGDRRAANRDMKDQLAVASIQASEDEVPENQNVSEAGVMPRQGVVTDLRTMIISSELLRPKYEEY